MKYKIEIELNCELADLSPRIFLMSLNSRPYTPAARVSIDGDRDIYVPIPVGFWTELNLLFYVIWRYYDIQEGM